MSRGHQIEEATSILHRHRDRLYHAGNDFLRLAAAQLSLRGDNQAMCQHKRSELFNVIREDVVAPTDGSPGLSRLIKGERGARAGAQVDLRMLASGASDQT